MTVTSLSLGAPPAVGLGEKIWRVNWGLILVLTAIAGVGVLALYSAAGGRFEPWAAKHAIRYGASLVLLLMVAFVHPKVWLSLAWPLYVFSLLLLIAVDVAGKIGMGAQRWLVIGPLQVQPSEIAKVAVILVLARYYHGLTREQAGKFLYTLAPLVVIMAPVALVMVQPDLGTALMVMLGGAALLFVAGVRLWMFLAAAIGAVGCLPIAWTFMHEYQRKRVLTFLDPDRDPLGAGYHITQSKIAIGSGGLFGKGFLKGTQSALNFLPEKQTDFIFTTFVEEWGMVGACVLLALFTLVLVWGFSIALRSQHHFGRLIALGVTAMMFLYVFINTAMVMGLLPVVGVPLPLVSNGGTAMVSVMFACGLMIGVNVYRDAQLPLAR
ncbi:cell elongation-specific peptidoglycan biosynthesis regulator RodA [Enhydrobacter aerosaccus]|uniref:Peptidoglycan glycosyltransferase MrdB n=1 Tax=Enhydrobacter aerosaccus TaxID=225324 RepID=A0A1T4SZU8_9HYPH|nr:rod shape-determining protein RodA [Enhydrobacter aerosaccus]SKA33764.1 cell elongation-specific peptidoglycan biosynthesis regulator RodA [Enhydrobacter aerosaccus]